MQQVIDIDCNIDWHKFLSKHDMVWTRMPDDWSEAPFLGNGMLGTFVCRAPNSNKLKFEVGRSDVFDHRSDNSTAFMRDRPRLPIGYFTLNTVGEITGVNLKLSLHNAQLTGEITTTKGSVSLSAFVHADKMAIILSATPTGGEIADWEWYPSKAINPRHEYGLINNQEFRIYKDYIPHPTYTVSHNRGINFCTQPLLMGGQFVTAWKEKIVGTTKTIFINTSYSNSKLTSYDATKVIINDVSTTNYEDLLKSHLYIWYEYYKKSFLSLPNKKLEGFYWIQMYKLRSAIRQDGNILDNQGPWLGVTPWPGLWWNLNVQLCYYPLYSSNRFELAESLWRNLIKNKGALINNVSEKYRYDSAGIATASADDLNSCISEPGNGKSDFVEMGNLTWALHDCYLHHRVTMDDALLRYVIYPLLRRCVNYYHHFLTEDKNGVLHLMPTSSPEYGVVDEDCNYDLSLLRWGISTLFYACDRLKISDELIPKWHDTISRLTDYPQDENEGYMIARNTHYAKSHRHYSHIMMAYPLYMVNVDNYGERELILKTVNHWQSLPELLCGFSITGAASFYAALGNGDEALRYLNQLFDFCLPNTMYKEEGAVIETPLSGAQCIHEMFLQSFGDKIRIFPAVPTEWGNVCFHNMRAEGAFEVSAKMVDGRISFVSVTSLAGEPCILKCKGLKTLVNVNEKNIIFIDNDTATIDIKKGEKALFVANNAKVTISEVKYEDEECYFGLM